MKELTINPGGKTSLQYHEHREEVWVVVSGNGKVIVGNEEKDVSKGDVIKVGKKVVHRIINPYNAPLKIIEVWIGDVLSEEDIVRLEDDYGRT